MFHADPAPYLARLGLILRRPDPSDTVYAPDASAVAFVCFATGCPPPARWRLGQRLRRGLPVAPGVLVATFDADGRYGCADGSAHAALALAVVPPDPQGADWVAQMGFLEVLEQQRHPSSASMVVAPVTAQRAALGPLEPPLPPAPLRRRRLPFVGGDLRRLGAGALLCDDADQYGLVALDHPAIEEAGRCPPRTMAG